MTKGKPCDGTDHVENLKEHCFGDGGVKFADIEGGGGRSDGMLGRSMVGGRGCGSGSGSSLGLDDRSSFGSGRHAEFSGFEGSLLLLRLFLRLGME